MSSQDLQSVQQNPKTAAILATVCVAAVLLPVSLTGASVAVPSIGADLGAHLAAVQWVVNGYDLTFAGVMLAAGSLTVPTAVPIGTK